MSERRELPTDHFFQRHYVSQAKISAAVVILHEIFSGTEPRGVIVHSKSLALLERKPGLCEKFPTLLTRISVCSPLTGQWWGFLELNYMNLLELFGGLLVHPDIIRAIFSVEHLPFFFSDEETGSLKTADDFNPKEFRTLPQCTRSFASAEQLQDLLVHYFSGYYRRLTFVMAAVAEELTEELEDLVEEEAKESTGFEEDSTATASPDLLASEVSSAAEASQDEEAPPAPSFFDFVVESLRDWGFSCCLGRV